MGKFLLATREAAKNVSLIADKLGSLGDGGASNGGGGGGGAQGGPVSSPTVFNTTVVVQQPKSIGGGDLQSRALSFYGVSANGKSDAFVRSLIAQFQRMLEKKGTGMDIRTGSAA